MNTALAALFLSVSQSLSLPAGLLSAVCWVESTHQTHTIVLDKHNVPSLGVCQVKLSTARLMGYGGSQEGLMNPELNIVFAARYLRYQLRRYQGDPVKAIGAYNSGTFKLRPHSNRPTNERYIKRVMKAWVDGR